LGCTFKGFTFLHSKANDWYNKAVRRYVSLTLLQLHQQRCNILYIIGVGNETLKKKGWGFVGQPDVKKNIQHIKMSLFVVL
jgi:hypothetical protein